MTDRPDRVALGNALEQARAQRLSGALDAARRRCEEILRQRPAEPGALALMAALAADEGRFEEGVRWATAAIAADPASDEPPFTMGRLYQGEGRLLDAERSYRRSLELAPARASAHNNLGCVLQMQGKLDAAADSFRRALEIDPSLPQANQNLAALTRDRSAAQVAIEGHLRTVRENPHDAQAWVNLGNTYREVGRHQEALDSFDHALERAPHLAEAHFARSFELLLTGKYAAGWQEYEWRWKVKARGTPMPERGAPLWDGRALPDAAVLLHAEQGLGDTLLCVRYASLVAQRCAAVYLECQPELVPLLARTRGLRGVLRPGDPRPPFGAHLPLMSLPRVFGTTLETVPWSGPYVAADPARAAACRALLGGAEDKLRVGLVWAGRPQQEDDRKRSISLAMLAPLAAIAGAAFYSLQMGEAAAQAKAPPAGLSVRDLSAHITDFADTAALVAQLDLVITVDTSVANLAGAMGRPTWVLLSSIPDWRYGLDREDTPWYPSMRLFRQTVDGDWAGPIQQATQALMQASRQRNG